MEKNKIIHVLLGVFFLNCSVFSQLRFEQGYYLDKNNERVDGLIKKLDWKNNPSNFLFKESEEGESKVMTINDVNEFSVGHYLKYITAVVEIDKSVININNVRNNEKLNFSEEVIFLKVLSEGEANLYSYEASNLIKYFFNVKSLGIQQLIYNKYVSENNNIVENNGFRQQLYVNLKCDEVKMAQIEGVEYKKNSLINFFEKYNKCKDPNHARSIKIEKRSFKEMFSFSAKVGVSNSKFSVDKTPFEVLDIDFDNETSLRVGLEMEFVLPYNKNKWGLILDPYYQKYRTQKNTIYTNLLSKRTEVYVDYQVLSIPFGIRYYSFLNNHSKLFFNFLFTVNVDLQKELTSDNDLQLFEIQSGSNLSAGIGYVYNDKFSIEFRNDFSRNMTDYYRWKTSFKSMSLTFGYRIF
jgi:hypothetical protein